MNQPGAAAGGAPEPAGDRRARACRRLPLATDQAPSPARNALEEFFASAFVRVVTGFILLDWIARRLVAWLSDRLYVVADRLTVWLSGPGHHYVDAGYPRLPVAVALVVVPTLLYLGFVRLTERRRVSELGGGRRGALEGLAGLGLGAGLFALIVAVLAVGRRLRRPRSRPVGGRAVVGAQRRGRVP